MFTITSCTHQALDKNEMKKFDIVTIEALENKDVLTKPARDVEFPLSTADQEVIQALKEKFAHENMAGLAAPQIGVHLRIIVFHVDKIALEFREDVEALVPLTVLINPSYESIAANGTNNDWEGCFSVESIRGKVDRYKTISYQGFTPEGKEVKGVANGFLARLLQHEIDHTNGILFTSRLKPENVQGPTEEMIKLRKQEIEERKAKCD